MNVEVFFYSLNQVERAKLMRFVKRIMLVDPPYKASKITTKALVQYYAHKLNPKMRREMMDNMDTLPIYASTMQPHHLSSIGLGKTHWDTFRRLRDSIENAEELSIEEIYEFNENLRNEEADNVREG